MVSLCPVLLFPPNCPCSRRKTKLKEADDEGGRWGREGGEGNSEGRETKREREHQVLWLVRRIDIAYRARPGSFPLCQQGVKWPHDSHECWREYLGGLQSLAPKAPFFCLDNWQLDSRASRCGLTLDAARGHLRYCGLLFFISFFTFLCLLRLYSLSFFWLFFIFLPFVT